MKRNFLFAAFGLIAIASVVTLNLKSGGNEMSYFVEEDNIALAEGSGYRCIPQTNWSCYIPSGGVGSFIPGFIWHA